MARVLDILCRLPRSDLADLMHLLEIDEAIHDTDDAATMACRVIDELRQLCSLQDVDDGQLERHLLGRVANCLGVDYDRAMEGADIGERVRSFISDAIVEDLRPFIQVAVCMGWADGALRPEEIAVVDAALSRLKLLVRRRGELLGLCSSHLRPEDLEVTLQSVAADEQKAWSLLAFAWGVALSDLRTHPQEIAVFHRLAGYLGLTQERADHLRGLVTRRFQDSFGMGPEASGARAGPATRSLSRATLGAITAAELDSYLQAKTGLKTLSLLLSSPTRSQNPSSSMEVVENVLGRDGWMGAPSLMAGTLFLRRVGHDVVAQKLLVTVLLCVERAR